MTTTTTFQGMEPGAKNSSRVLRPLAEPLIFPSAQMMRSLCAKTRWPPVSLLNLTTLTPTGGTTPRKFIVLTRGGEASGVLCGEPSAPLRRCQPAIVYDNDAPAERPANCVDQNEHEQENNEEAVEQKEEAGQPSAPSAANPSGRRNPPGGKSSLILG